MLRGINEFKLLLAFYAIPLAATGKAADSSFDGNVLHSASRAGFVDIVGVARAEIGVNDANGKIYPRQFPGGNRVPAHHVGRSPKLSFEF